MVLVLHMMLHMLVRVVLHMLLYMVVHMAAHPMVLHVVVVYSVTMRLCVHGTERRAQDTIMTGAQDPTQRSSMCTPARLTTTCIQRQSQAAGNTRPWPSAAM